MFEVNIQLLEHIVKHIWMCDFHAREVGAANIGIFSPYYSENTGNDVDPTETGHSCVSVKQLRDSGTKCDATM